MSRKYWELGYSGDWIPMSTDEAFEKKVAILGWSRTENRAFYEDLVPAMQSLLDVVLTTT